MAGNKKPRKAYRPKMPSGALGEAALMMAEGVNRMSGGRVSVDAVMRRVAADPGLRADPVAAFDRLRHAALRQNRAPIGRECTSTLLIKARTAMVDVTHGRGTADEHDILGSVVNVSILAAQIGIGAEYLAEMHAARDAVIALGRRGEEKGRWAFDGPGLAAMQFMLDLHEAQLDDERMTVAVFTGIIDRLRKVTKTMHAAGQHQAEVTP